MQIKVSKRARKYIDRVDENTRNRLWKALEQLSLMEGDIKPIRGMPSRYRYKIHHYRILFNWEKGDDEILVVDINTRTDIRYGR